MQDNRLVGILDDSDIVHVLDTDEISRSERFAKPVRSAMAANLDTLQVNQSLDDLIPIFDQDRVAIVLDGQEFVGLITRVDLINYLRLHPEGANSQMATV
jgi:cystathionine beta-synthase